MENLSTSYCVRTISKQQAARLSCRTFDVALLLVGRVKLLSLPQLAVQITPKTVDFKTEKPKYDTPPHTGYKKRYYAWLTNQRRRSGSNCNVIFWRAAFWGSNQAVAVHRYLAPALFHFHHVCL